MLAPWMSMPLMIADGLCHSGPAEVKCGQDGVEPPIFRFSGMRITAGQTVRARAACRLRAASVLDHDGLGEPCGVAVGGQVGQGRCYLGIAAVDGVEVAVRGRRRRPGGQRRRASACRLGR